MNAAIFPRALRGRTFSLTFTGRLRDDLGPAVKARQRIWRLHSSTLHVSITTSERLFA